MMATRHLFLAVVLCAVVCKTAWAHFPVDVNPRTDDGLLNVGWTPVQVGILSRCPLQLVSGTADVYGVAAGVLCLEQQSAVVSAALENSVCINYLAQAGLVDVCEFNCAFEIGVFNVTGRNLGVCAGVFNFESNFGERLADPYPWLPGLQVGLFNVGGGVQIGLLNYNPQGFVPWFPVINFPWRHVD